MFVDRVLVTLRAGNGGDGVMSFRHEKFRPLGGPDGGDGGDGGDIILIASRNENTLAAFRYQKLLRAENGRAGGKAKRHGKSGKDLQIAVPVGTIVVNSNAAVLADLTRDGQKNLLARGGKGGFGNAHFVSSTRQAPRVSEKGEPGEAMEVVLELKMIADVGIVGLPNAGKSTLLSVISNAKPEIAAYPFTTLHPNLGIVDIDKKQSLLFADIPGLIEGASHGKGLGDEFLRHVERTSVLVHLIDIYNHDIPAAYKTIMGELKDYKVDLSQKPQIIALTKTEGIDKKQVSASLEDIRKLVAPKIPVMAVSSVSRQGVDELLRTIWQRVEQARRAGAKKQARPKLPIIGIKNTDDFWQISQRAETFIITGNKIERLATRTRFGDPFAEQRLRDVMRKIGITRELERRGARTGQTVQIGNPSKGELTF